ncbi:MAG TPA: PKD domain-containing protein, partial [Cyclobacteriaceae bacterium]|nr:PKD domain-containing protein [Cyclobacteriaceae bacterium]
MIKCYSIIPFLLIAQRLLSQTVQADFSIPSQVCVNENWQPINLSVGAASYEWDFCQGDLAQHPNASFIKTLGGGVTTGIDLVFDGANWFGFITSQGTNSILRLDYGPDIYSTPIVNDLGNIDGNINAPTDIKIVSENGNWFGFVYGLSDPIISRINFGSSLTNTTSGPIPITSDPLLSGAGSVNAGLDVIKDGSDWTIVLTLNSSFTVIRLPTITSMPLPLDIISGIVSPFGNTLGDLVLQEYNGNFYGFVVAHGNRTLQRLSFGSSVFSIPVIDNISLSVLSGVTPYGIDIGHDNGIYYLLISTLQGDLLRISLGQDISIIDVTGSSLGFLSVLENTLKIRLVYSEGRWVAFSPSWNTTRLYRIDFPEPLSCPSEISFSTLEAPELKYIASGTQYITLKSSNGGNFEVVSKPILIGSQIAPDISFSSQNICANHDINFTSENVSGGITDYNWDFGDTNTSMLENPTHQYTSAGEYEVLLNVTASNGCNNIARQNITIYNEPVPDFNLPAAAPICTN